jgi:hypothetical protein
MKLEMLLEMDECRGCGDGGGCEDKVSGDDGWRRSLRCTLANARVPSMTVRRKLMDFLVCTPNFFVANTPTNSNNFLRRAKAV